MDAIDEIVTGWGYDKQHYRIWGAVDGKDGQFFQIFVDHLAEEVAIRAVGEEVDGHLYLNTINNMSWKEIWNSRNLYVLI